MEMTGRNHITVIRICLCTLLLSVATLTLMAQQPVQKYTVKDGKMFIELGKQIRETALDSFVAKYDLEDLALKEFMRTNNPDSLVKLGWKVLVNNETGVVISKPLIAFDDLENSVNKIILSENLMKFSKFPAPSGPQLFGQNRFRNKNPFHANDSIVIFFLRDHPHARKVMLAGSFNDWSPETLPMKQTDSGWIAHVKLPPGKHWYKFIVNNNWIVDNDNLNRENDGEGNTNSVFYKTNYKFRLNGFNTARRVYVAGSFNNWQPHDLSMHRTADGWELPIYLAEGTHLYKFVVDDKWFKDPQNPESVPDGVNGMNSVLRLGKPYLFRLKGYEHAKQVTLAGSFNNWRDFEFFMEKTKDGWELPFVIGPGNYEYRFKVDGKWVTDPDNPNQGERKEGNSFLIIEPNYTFRLKGHGGAKKVFLAGDFNSWNPTAYAMRKEGDDWVFNLHLGDGKHRYKYIIDGEWKLDPNNKLWEQNEYGTGNSIIWIRKWESRKK